MDLAVACRRIIGASMGMGPAAHVGNPRFRPQYGYASATLQIFSKEQNQKAIEAVAPVEMLAGVNELNLWDIGGKDLMELAANITPVPGIRLKVLNDAQMRLVQGHLNFVIMLRAGSPNVGPLRLVLCVLDLAFEFRQSGSYVGLRGQIVINVHSWLSRNDAQNVLKCAVASAGNENFSCSARGKPKVGHFKIIRVPETKP